MTATITYTTHYKYISLKLLQCLQICSISLVGGLVARRGRDNALPTGIFSGTHTVLGNGFGDGWSAISAAVELGCLTNPGLGDFCSVPGINGPGLIPLAGSQSLDEYGDDS